MKKLSTILIAACVLQTPFASNAKPPSDIVAPAPVVVETPAETALDTAIATEIAAETAAETENETAADTEADSTSKHFLGGTIYVKKGFDLSKKDYRKSHATKTFKMFTSEDDAKLEEAKKELYQAQTVAPNSPYFLQALGKVVSAQHDVAKCTLAVETGSSHVSFQQGREYNIKPANDPKNPNRFNIELKFEKGGKRDAYLNCAPSMTEEEVIEALGHFGFQTNPGKSVAEDKQNDMAEGSLLSADDISEQSEANKRYSSDKVIDEDSALSIKGFNDRLGPISSGVAR